MGGRETPVADQSRDGGHAADNDANGHFDYSGWKKRKIEISKLEQKWEA